MCKILIVTHRDDLSANNVIEWLIHYNADFIRWNSEDDFDFELILENNRERIFVYCNGERVNLKDIGAVWFRRGYVNIPVSIIQSDIVEKSIEPFANNHLKRERNTIQTYIYEKLKEKPHINFPLCYDVNKLSVLGYAKMIGIKIPETIVTKNKDVIDGICKRKSKYITKSISDNLVIRQGYIEKMLCLTNDVGDFNKANDLEEFYYSLFQKKVKKKYEIRMFFLFEKYFAAAIMPWQFYDNTDGRVLNVDDDLKRICPIIVPEEILLKLKKLMTMIGLESGSIDMIVTPSDEYVFLEVNPVGQFDYINKRCNYNIDKLIASTLIKMRDE